MDNIPNIALKNLPDSTIQSLSIIFNNLLNNSYFPNCWKIAKVIPIQKKEKNPNLICSYRPISLLSNTGKLLEVIINRSISKYADENQIVPYEQFGFRKKHSTIHAVTKLVSDENQAFIDKKFTAACFIDLEKAFDSVWVNGLIYKMIKKGFPTHLIKIVQDMLNNRKMYVSTNKDKSENYTILEGLQKDAVNSPILFNIYICDILRSYELNKNENKRGLGFADDLILYTLPMNVCTKLKKSYKNCTVKLLEC